MVKSIREVEKALGSGVKKPTQEEEENIKIIGRRVVAKSDIPAGTVITKELLAIKRANSGIETSYLDKILGKAARHSLKKGDGLTLEKVKDH